MKKLFSMVALATMIFATSCSDEEQVGPAQVGEVDVTFEVGLPGIDTRAISDGKTAKTLSWAVYESGQTTPLAVSEEDGATFNASRCANFNIKLLAAKRYDIIFWADATDSPYTFDMAAQTVSFKDGAAVLANDENRDAFYAVLKDFSFTGKQEQVTLSRPFAQVNFGTDDLDIIADQFVPSESKVVVENAYTGINLMTGVPTGEAAAVTYDFAATPQTTEKFPIEPETYQYLATAYVIVPADKSVVTAGFTAKNEANKEQDKSYDNVPVQRNYRTNIYGSLLTSAQGFKVTISQGYEGNLVTDGVSFQKAMQQGGDVVLAGDITTGSLPINTEKPTTVDLNGNTLTLNFASSTTIGNGADITFKNGTIVNTRLSNTPTAAPVLLSVNTNSSVTLDGVILEVPNASALFPRGDAAHVTVRNSTIKAKSYAIGTNAGTVDNYGVIIDLSNSTFEGSSPVFVNIPCSLKVTDCTVKGGLQGVVVRGGTAAISGSDISLDYEGTAEEIEEDSSWYSKDWGTGNSIPAAAMTIGNRSTTAYQYATNVTLTNTKVYTTGDNASHFPAMYVYANQGEGLGVTLTYDTQSTFTGGTPGNIVYGITTNVLVNGAQPE